VPWAPGAARAADDVKVAAKRAASTRPAPTAISTPIRLAYAYKPGDVRRYKVTGFFTGHFPPFAGAGAPPIHLMTVLEYSATVKKVSDKGAEVEFVVDNADLSLLEEEPGPDGKIDPDKVAPFPLPLQQVQKTLNTTAIFKPNGAVTEIRGGDASGLKVDLGIDLRKLFLVTEPITLADKPVKTGDTWPFDDGLLGTRPGKTTYTGRLQSIAGGGKRVVATVSQEAESTVDGKLDKEGNSTENAGAAVGTLVGKVTLTGASQVVGSAGPPGPTPAASGRVTDAHMSLVANLKRTMPDPDQPGKQQVTDIDIKARLTVAPISRAATPSPTSGGSSSDPKGATPKSGGQAKSGKKA
jgi:hypothetical protein